MEDDRTRAVRPVDQTGDGLLGSGEGYARRALVVGGVITLFVALAAAFAHAYDVFFLFFAAIVLAVFLRGAADSIGRRTGLGPGWSLALVLLAVVIVLGATVYAIGAAVAAQAEQFAIELPRALEHVRGYLDRTDWGRAILAHVFTAQENFTNNTGGITSAITSFFSTTLGVIGNILILTALSVYLAADPRLYVAGVLAIVPPHHRDRAGQVLSAVGYHLWWWLAGRAVTMLSNGLLTAAGLWLIGVPQYLVLGLLSALFSIIPFFGPILGAIPGLLLAMLISPTTVLWTALVYTLAEAVESYLVTPLVQQGMVRLPPAVAIAAITLFGALFGVLGLIVASPLVVAIIVAVKMLYLEDTLGDNLEVPGASENKAVAAAEVAVSELHRPVPTIIIEPP